ncbi:helix-turn-helix transcriptional regulator [Thalassobius sp. I31.1]|uniref:helix-turn-helix domain-containing protein n=1 Tax=Thalassobius sp. I31.1 TaxID=2109912 RepID=UPI000D1B3040|nr:helix-turn-helix transcriptional regulator [Thalassobius sp. I31.1]
MSTGAKEDNSIDVAIGAALRQLRQGMGWSASELATKAGISAAMVSRIENGQVSPSISSLCALSAALDVPLVSLFRETANSHADYTLVRAGEGVVSTRISQGHSHEFVNLAVHSRRDLQFEARRVTLTRQEAQPPTYVGHGVVYLHVLEGSAIYRYGGEDFTLSPGDSLSVDAELNHGFVEVLTEAFTFLSVQAERR